MIKSNKISCEYSTFIDKLQPGRNYSTYKMVSIGNTDETSLGYHSFKTLLSFNTKNINSDKIINAYLSVFIRKVETAGHASCNIGLYIGKEFEDYDAVTWASLDNDDPSNILSISIPTHISNSFVKINITKLIKNHSKNTGNLNIVLFPANYDENYAVVISSANAKNPPFIEFQLNDTEINDSVKLNNKNSSNNVTQDLPDSRYTSLLTKIDNNEVMNKELQNNINKILDKLTENSKKSSTIYNTINSLVNSINKSEISLTELNKNILTIINNESGANNTDNSSAFPEQKFAAITAKLDETKSSLDKLITLLSTLSIQNIE